METVDSIYPEGEGSQKFFKASDFPKPKTLTILKAEKQVLKEKTKLIVSFTDEEKLLVLNQTNAREIAKLHGQEYDTWTGKEITLAAVPVKYQGEDTKGIRVIG